MESQTLASVDVNEDIWRDLSTLEQFGDAARDTLAAGIPIYYRADDTPTELLIKEYPDGHRELVRYNRAGDEVIRAL